METILYLMGCLKKIQPTIRSISFCTIKYFKLLLSSDFYLSFMLHKNSCKLFSHFTGKHIMLSLWQSFFITLNWNLKKDHSVLVRFYWVQRLSFIGLDMHFNVTILHHVGWLLCHYVIHLSVASKLVFLEIWKNGLT